MQQESSDIRYIIGDRDLLDGIRNIPALPFFSGRVILFLSKLSNRLMNDEGAKKYPDIVAFAFWIRKASMEKQKELFASPMQRVGRGLAFHITPSNIPLQFAVSLVYALVSGNASVVRLSEKDFPQVGIVCGTIHSLLDDEFKDLRPYICVIRYGHDDRITGMLSEMCDARLVWGGNATITAVRKIQAPPRCIDLGFADRYSIAVIDSGSYLEKDTAHVANDFYNDTYFSDQNACSSPRLIVWLGNRIHEAKERFWGTLNELVRKKYNMEPVCGSEKLLKTAVCAVRHPGVKEIRHSNALVRVELPALYDDIMEYRGNCGYFFEYDAEKIDEILPLLKKECQTITYIGDIEAKLRELVATRLPKGVDRIVPVGHGSSISFVWDGIELPFALSRCIGNT